jgi:hypothetical protein
MLQLGCEENIYIYIYKSTVRGKENTITLASKFVLFFFAQISQPPKQRKEIVETSKSPISR